MDARGLAYLKVFVVLGHELTFSRAAKAVGLSQSAVSRQIAELEGIVGFQLFLRSTRRVELSPAGERLWRGAIAGLATIDAALVEAREVASGRRGLIRIGYTRVSMLRVGAEMIGALKRDFPDVAVSLHEIGSDRQAQALIGNSIDIGLLHPPLSTDELRIEMLGNDDIVAVAAERHPLTRKHTLPLAALRDESMILYPRAIGPALYDALVLACRDAGFDARIIQHCASWDAAIDLAAIGLGIAWVPRVLARERRSQVRILGIREALPPLPFALATRRDGDALIRSITLRIRRSDREAPLAGHHGAR